MSQNDINKTNEECSELTKKLEALEQECCFLRCILISDPELNPLIKGKDSTFLEKSLELKKKCNEEMPTDRDSLLRELAQLKKQTSNLFREVEHMREENDDIYNTIETITKEKGELTNELHRIQDEVDVTKQVINFLVNERDKMKKDIEIKDAKIAEYHRSITRHGSYIISAQNPLPRTPYKKPLSDNSPL